MNYPYANGWDYSSLKVLRFLFLSPCPAFAALLWAHVSDRGWINVARLIRVLVGVKHLVCFLKHHSPKQCARLPLAPSTEGCPSKTPVNPESVAQNMSTAADIGRAVRGQLLPLYFSLLSIDLLVPLCKIVLTVLPSWPMCFGKIRVSGPKIFIGPSSAFLFPETISPQTVVLNQYHQRREFQHRPTPSALRAEQLVWPVNVHEVSDLSWGTGTQQAVAVQPGRKKGQKKKKILVVHDS